MIIEYLFIFKVQTIMTTLHSFILIGILVLALSSLRKWNQKRNGINTAMHSVWILGLLLAVIGILLQVLEMQQAFQSIENTGQLSPEDIALEIKSSFNFSIVGILFFALSIIFDLVLKSSAIGSSFKPREEILDDL